MDEVQNSVAEERINSIKKLIDEFPVTPDSISKLERHDLKELNLLDYQGIFVFFANLVKDFANLDLSSIHLISLNRIFSLFQDIQFFYEEIYNLQNHSFNQDNKNEIGKRLNGHYSKVVDHILPLISYYSNSNSSIESKTQKLHELNTYYGNIFKNSKAELDSQSDEFARVIQESKETIANENVHKHAHIFNSESILHKKAANWSLGLVIGIIISIVIFSIYYILVLIPEIKPEETMKIIQYSIAKLIILSSLFYGLSLSVKNYKAHKHNEIVNKHRQNALSTFQTFSMAADNDISVKNAILLEATRTIFSAQQSGYLSNENETDSPNRIIEIIKNVTTNAR